MKNIKYLLSILCLLVTSLIHANTSANPELDKAIVSEQKTYQAFKEVFESLVTSLMDSIANTAQDDNIMSAHRRCVHQQKIVKMLLSNQKYKEPFDQEFAEDQRTFDEALNGFKNSVTAMKPYCDKIQAEYDKNLN
ncbi:hypothetical protein ACG9X6_07775 [Acinetobacter guillouiae]|uniref:hypothetical protein n=1 Tax=Acinetobacter TaxID=469 RepID=UPI001FB9F371|nr:hypothetical protein [Acinetobacter sp. NyZ410]UOH19463.1 hypothetical protein MTO68_04620 [Acinetobacter sp. NyZ410]